jgi:hypothetical protein
MSFKETAKSMGKDAALAVKQGIKFVGLTAAGTFGIGIGMMAAVAASKKAGLIVSDVNKTSETEDEDVEDTEKEDNYES